jgi:hypothetical protein
MRINGMTSTLCLGAAAAIALVFSQHVAAPLIGSSNVLALVLVGFTVSYAALLGATPRRALRNGAAALAGSIIVALFSDGVVGLALGQAIVLGAIRSGLEYSMKPARAVVVESILLVLGLGFAFWIAWPGWLGEAAGLWGFALVQCLYFIVPGRRRADRRERAGDPFDRAREQLLTLLEEV